MAEDENWLYLNNPEDTVRYVLGEKGVRIVACIGINPSTARPNTLDNTLRSVKRIAQFNGYDGWVMYNVYPQRATDPNHLHSEMDSGLQQKNNMIINQSIQDLGIDTIWMAYGDLIESRDYLPYCMICLFEHLKHFDVKWKTIGETIQKGHPKHPLYKPTQSRFVDFDMEKYINEKLKLKIS